MKLTCVAREVIFEERTRTRRCSRKPALFRTKGTHAASSLSPPNSTSRNSQGLDLSWNVSHWVWSRSSFNSIWNVSRNNILRISCFELTWTDLIHYKKSSVAAKIFTRALAEIMKTAANRINFFVLRYKVISQSNRPFYTIPSKFRRYVSTVLITVVQKFKLTYCYNIIYVKIL